MLLKASSTQKIINTSGQSDQDISCEEKATKTKIHRRNKHRRIQNTPTPCFLKYQLKRIKQTQQT